MGTVREMAQQHVTGMFPLPSKSEYHEGLNKALLWILGTVYKCLPDRQTYRLLFIIIIISMGCFGRFQDLYFFHSFRKQQGSATNAISKTSVKKQDTTALYIHHHHHIN